MDTDVISTQKAIIRQQALARRREQPHKDELSRSILASAAGLPAYRQASTVHWFVDRRDEVRTRPALLEALTEGKRLVVPYCAGDELLLFHLESLDELQAMAFGLLEPRLELRTLPGKRVMPDELDAVLVPGLAFDPRGTRIGYGKGYFDRLLKKVRPDTALIAVAFQCQMFPELPSTKLDVPVGMVVTEQQVYDCR